MAQSAQHRFGLGIHLGDPNAVTAKYWFDRYNGLQFMLGYKSSYYHWNGYYYADYGGPLLAVDWTSQFLQWEPRRGKVHMGIHAGIGGGLGWGGCWYDYYGVRRCDPVAVLRAPLGFDVSFPKPRIEVYAELVPALSLAPGFGPALMGGLGARFYF